MKWDPTGYTPLMMSIATGDHEAVKLIMEHNADITVPIPKKIERGPDVAFKASILGVLTFLFGISYVTST